MGIALIRTNDAAEVLKVAFVESVTELIGHYAGEPVEFEPVEATTFEAACAASVGFSDEKFRGSAVLTISHECCVTKIGAPEGASKTDWFGELGNQLVGRFKNKIARYGLLISMGLPSVTCGEKLVHGDENRAGCWYLRWDGFEFSALLNLDVEESLTLELAEEPSTAEEGSLCLF